MLFRDRWLGTGSASDAHVEKPCGRRQGEDLQIVMVGGQDELNGSSGGLDGFEDERWIAADLNIAAVIGCDRSMRGQDTPRSL